MQILVLGGVGAMCTPATRDVAKRGEFSEVKLADIDTLKLENLADEIGLSKDDILKVDATDKASLKETMKDYDVVINGLPKKFADDVVDIALEVGVNCCDLGSPSERMLSLDSNAKQKGITYCAGCGATPGITNMMAAHGAQRMDEVEEVNVSFAAVRSFALSPALLYTIMWEFDPEVTERAYYRNGEFYPVPPFSGEKTIDFPQPIGSRKVYFVPHGETRTFPKNIEGVKRVHVRGTFSHKDMSFLKSLLDYGFYSETPITVKGTEITPRELISNALLEIPEATEEEDLWGYGLHVEVIGKDNKEKVKRTYWSTHPGMGEWGIPWAYSNNVGLPLSVAAHMIGKGKAEKGINTPGALFEPESFFSELRKRKINVNWKTEAI